MIFIPSPAFLDALERRLSLCFYGVDVPVSLVVRFLLLRVQRCSPWSLLMEASSKSAMTAAWLRSLTQVIERSVDGAFGRDNVEDRIDGTMTENH